MRGNPALSHWPTASARSIPAHAGEPSGCGRWLMVEWVYPRACGGTIARFVEGFATVGLSPRMRGNHIRIAACRVGFGSIPAHAGEPLTEQFVEHLDEVYPRACGGTFYINFLRSPCTGLSPRMRGNRFVDRFHVMRPGSIPAHAGEPFWEWVASWAILVYPRACGGTVLLHVASPADYGLSPRMRGNLAPALVAFGLEGSIPAHAGEPGHPRRRGDHRRVYPRACGGTSSLFTF